MVNTKVIGSLLGPFGDPNAMLDQLKLPGVDTNAIEESHRRGMEVLLATNKATFDSIQELAKKQAEIFIQAMQSAQSPPTGEARSPNLVDQSNFVREAYEKAVAEMSELINMARKAQAEAMAEIEKRAQQSIDEMKKLEKRK